MVLDALDGVQVLRAHGLSMAGPATEDTPPCAPEVRILACSDKCAKIAHHDQVKE